MGFGTPPTVLEGDYSDWSIYDSFDDTEMYAGDWENAAIFNKEKTVAVLVDANVCKKYTIATKTLGASLFNPSFLSGGFCGMGLAVKSVLGTYVVSIDGADDNLYIIKNGVVVKTMSYADLGFTLHYIRSVSISPSGKYVFVSGTRSATGNTGWVILVGS